MADEANQAGQQNENQPNAHPALVWVLGIYFLLAATALLFLLVFIWPESGKAEDTGAAKAKPETEMTRANVEESKVPPGSAPTEGAPPAKAGKTPAAKSPAKAESSAASQPPSKAATPSEKQPTGNAKAEPQKHPVAQAKPESQSEAPQDLFQQTREVLNRLNEQERFFLIVVLAGALGSYIHAAQSLVSYVGNQNFKSSWFLWYLLRPFIGSALASVFYLVVRGGFMTAQVSSGSLNPYGFAALAAMAGMFSKEATDKLSELFKNVFKVDKPVNRNDPLDGKDT